MNRGWRLAVAALALTMWLTPPSLAPVRAHAGLVQKAAPTVQTSGLQDERGRFRAFLDGQPVGVEEFSIGRSGAEWVCRGTAEIQVPGSGSQTVTSVLHLSVEGNPVSYTWTAKGQKKAGGSANFSASGARMDLQAEGNPPFTQEFQFESGRIVVLDNNLYHQYALLARLYDWNAKGAQTFSVLIPQDLTPGIITVEWAGPQAIDNTKYDVLRVKSSDLLIELYVAGGRLMRLVAPDSKVEVRRE